jgi:predicted flap endonuclease-1-like 5' DNA nuclease
MTFSGLSYLATNFLWWWIAALVIGLIIGWMTFEKGKKSSGFFPWLLVLAVGMVVAYLKIVPERIGLWFDTAVLMATSYFVGCFLGGLLRQFFGTGEVVAVSAPIAKVASSVATLAAVTPYQWQAQKDGSTVTLVGFAPSSEAKNRIVASAKAIFAGASINDRLQLGSGAPTGLETLTGAAFGHLAKLDKGIASLVDTSYTLTGAAGTDAIKTTVDSAVNALPSGFTLAKVLVSAPIVALVSAPVAAAPVETDKPVGLASPRSGKADDLKRIRGIGKQNEGRLHGLGIWHFDQIAAWSKKEIEWVGHFLAFPGRIEREDWVPQAKVLATGAETEFSKRVDRGEVATSADDGSNGQSNVQTLTADGGYEGKRPASLTAARNNKPDDLKLINGVGVAIEKKLNDVGIWHFDQVAQMSNDELTWVSAYSGFPGRAIRENWKGDSAILAVGGETDHSKAVKAGKIPSSVNKS